MIIKIYCDGGCVPNPGQMYGSYAIEMNGQEIISNTEDYDFGTNNVAEFTSLHRALLKTSDLLDVINKPPGDCRLYIYTDSTVIRNRLMGSRRRNKAKTMSKNEGRKRMAYWTEKCWVLLCVYKHWEAKWQSRELNVQRFGH